MSCWHKTIALRIPASALGFKYLYEWKEFLNKHEEDFQWEEECFCEAMCDDYPGILGSWKTEFTDPYWKLDQLDPKHPEIIPGPFLDYYLEDIYPLHPEDNKYGENDEVLPLDADEMNHYLPIYQSLFPQFTLKEMEAVRLCKFEWYDGSGASYLYSEWL